MDIVDTQVHLNRIGALDAGLAAMDAVGVAALLYDEAVGLDDQRRPLPHRMLPNGVARPISPQAEAAAALYPARIGVLQRLDHRDPDLDALVGRFAAAPHAGALRVALLDEVDVEAFARGDFAELFAVADRHDMAVVVLAPGRTELLPPYIDSFPNLRFVIDHCGVPLRPGQAGVLDKVLELARYPNLTLKWAHAPFVLSAEPYPFSDVIPLLRRALTAFGPERVMWGSDFMVPPGRFSWAETLFYIRDAEALSDEEKAWVLGCTARAVFRWPAPIVETARSGA